MKRSTVQKTREKDKKNLYPYITQIGGDREDHPDHYIANRKDGASTTPEAEPIAVIGCASSADWKTYSASVVTDVSSMQALYFTWKGSGAADFSESAFYRKR